jgi:hypothetical protein
MTSEKNWILKYQQLFQFYLTHHCCEVPRKAEMATLADWVLYQRTKFKSDPDTFDSHRIHLLRGIKKSFVKEDNSKASFDTNLEAYIQFKGCRNTISIPKDHNLHGWWKHWRFQGKRFLKGSPTKLKTILQDFSSVLVMVFFQDFQLKRPMMSQSSSLLLWLPHRTTITNHLSTSLN